MKPADSTHAELDALVRLFFPNPERLGMFESVSSDQVPSPSRELLAHEHHMTVTVEKYHGCPVDVLVLASRTDGNQYSREILLTCQTDHRVVQYGIVRLDLTVLSPVVRQEIVAQTTPLGRVLIQHNVLRRVKLLGLWKITAGVDLAAHLGLHPGAACYGRTALIYLDGSPAIELLEIVI